MAKEPEPRSIGENQDSVGDLSAYVSKRLNDISIQRAEAEAKALAAKDSDMELFRQRTALLREHLLELAAPMDELLSRFRVRELLEEAQSKFCTDGSIKKLESRIYRAVVSQPDLPEASFYWLIEPKYGSLVKTIPAGNFVDPNRLLVPENFQGFQVVREIKSKNDKSEPFEGYGLALKRKLRSRVARVEWRRTSEGSSTWWGNYGGQNLSPATYGWVKTGGTADAVESRSIIIEVVKSNLAAYPYDLSYAYFRDQYDPYPERQIGERRIKAQEEREYLTPPTRIYANQQPEVLIKLIGDDVINLKEF